MARHPEFAEKARLTDFQDNGEGRFIAPVAISRAVVESGLLHHLALAALAAGALGEDLVPVDLVAAVAVLPHDTVHADRDGAAQPGRARRPAPHAALCGDGRRRLRHRHPAGPARTRHRHRLGLFAPGLHGSDDDVRAKPAGDGGGAPGPPPHGDLRGRAAALAESPRRGRADGAVELPDADADLHHAVLQLRVRPGLVLRS